MSGLDVAIHPPVRLQLCGMLAAVDTLEFAFARERLDVSDSVLSKHIKALADEGYVTVSKSSDSRRRTWISFTPTGRVAFRRHVQELQRLASG